MSDYTPTTEEVKSAYCFVTDANAAGSAFDRWLAAHDAEVRKQTREDAGEDAWWYAKLHGLSSADCFGIRHAARGDGEQA